MIVDTSALVAILLDEPEPGRLQTALATAGKLGMSAASWIELTVVLSRKGRTDLISVIERLRDALSIRIIAVDAAQAEIARAAYLRFGRGSEHRARLNFGDCFAHKLATTSDEPLLFNGDDFTHTDVCRAIDA